MGPPESPWQLSLPCSHAHSMLSAIWRGYSILHLWSVTTGTSTFISLLGSPLSPEWRVPHPETVQDPSDCCMASGRGTGATFSFITNGSPSSQIAMSFSKDFGDPPC